MSLSTGSRLGPYEIVSLFGAGEMGEVYRARDPRLGREVAIKVLPAVFSADADRPLAGTEYFIHHRFPAIRANAP